MTTETLRDGRFVVLGSIGEGSQGRTFDGFDRLEGKPVAIKRFDVRGAKEWKDVELAEREARVLQSLSHPMLPRYVERFEENGALYLVMEKIEGESLAALRARHATLSEGEVVRLLRDAAEVLDYLHGRAPPVIHRDIKPGNVIRRPDGSYAFVDFGAVRDKLRPEGGSTVVGTFGYMAPEQFQGRALPGSDVYAVGATALTMLTGQSPEDLPHKGLAIDVRAALRGRSERLAGVLEAMLDPDPDRRPAAIRPLLERAGHRTAPPRPSRDRDEERHAERRDRRARREARRQARHEARALRRARGMPFPFSLLFGIALAVAMVAVAIATQVAIPLVLTVLSVFLARRSLRDAAGRVRDAGENAMRNIERSRRWLSGEPGGGADESQARVRIDTPAGGVRVANEERASDLDDDEEEGLDTEGEERHRL